MISHNRSVLEIIAQQNKLIWGENSSHEKFEFEYITGCTDWKIWTYAFLFKNQDKITYNVSFQH